MGWLELQAYKKNLRPLNTELVSSIYIDNYKLADSLENKGRSFVAVMEYERILRNYNRYFNLDSVSDRLEKLKISEDYNNEIKTRQVISKKENEIFERFSNRFDEEIILEASKIILHGGTPI